MRLLRIRLRNYRGTGEREVRFRSEGITVVAGANEAGKSSLMEAFRLALKFRDNSRAAPVKAVQPVGTDLATEVEVELRTGPYHFTLVRRWHKETSTRLVVHAPQAEEHAGRLADDRLQEILVDTVDTDLMDALHMGQDDKQLEQAAPNPWGGALAEALMAGRDQIGCRLDTTLVDLAAAERERWFTPTGREKKELKSFTDAIRQAEVRLAQIRQTQEELDGCVAEHQRVSAERAAVLAELDQVTAELEGLALRRSKLDAARALRDRCASEAEAAEANARAASAAANARRAAARRVDELATRIAELAEADESGKPAREQAAADASRLRAEAVQLATAAEEAAKVAGEAAAVQRRAELAERLAMSRSQVESERVRAAADRARAFGGVRLDVMADVELLIDGSPESLVRGEHRQLDTATPAVIEIPGVARLSVEPGEAAAELRRAAEEASGKLVAGLEEAVRRGEAELEALGGGPGIPSAEATEEAEAAAVKELEAVGALRAGEEAAAEAEAKARDLQAQHQRATDQLAEARRYLGDDQADLASAREEAGDEVLEQAARTAAEAAAQAAVALAEAEEAVREWATDSLVERVESLEAEAHDLRNRSEGARDRLARLSERARLLSDQGLHTRLQDAEAEHDALVVEADRQRRRAEVADLLWSTLDRHRRDAEAAYRDPLRARIEELGRALLGPSFSVEMSDDLRVARRRLAGRTIDVSELSAGAREQLALLGRVACASLAARDGAGAPLVLDDTLGFSDPDRRAGVSRILSEATAGCQVIILTCDPGRYDGLQGAELVEL